jgi:glycosyltransferase involved in cell wall biosynthesis
LIVVDDGSTDQTKEIVSRWAAKDSRVRLIAQRNAGVAAARNRAVQAATGAFIAPLDADDLWHREKIERQLRVFERSRSDVALVYGSSVLIDGDGRIVRKPLPMDHFDFEGEVLLPLIWRNFGCASVPLIRRDALIAVGGYDVNLRQQGAEGCEDIELYIRLAEKWPFARASDAMTGHRYRPDSMSHNIRSMHRSHNIVIQEALRRNPWIPRKIVRWSNARANVAYAFRSARQKDRLRAANFLLRAVFGDPLYVGLSSIRLVSNLEANGGAKEKRFHEIDLLEHAPPRMNVLQRRHKCIDKLRFHSRPFQKADTCNVVV